MPFCTVNLIKPCPDCNQKRLRHLVREEALSRWNTTPASRRCLCYRALASSLIELPLKLLIRIIRDLTRDNRSQPCHEQEFDILRNVTNLIRREQRAADVLLAEGETCFVGIERAGHRIEHDGALTEEVGDETGAVMIVDAEHLEDTGIGEEGAGALA